MRVDKFMRVGKRFQSDIDLCGNVSISASAHVCVSARVCDCRQAKCVKSGCCKPEMAITNNLMN